MLDSVPCPTPPTKWATLYILGLYSLAQLLGGFTFSLLSPFYTAEAKNKGLSVTQSTLVNHQSRKK